MLRKETKSIKLTKEQQLLVEQNHNLIYGFCKMKGLNSNEFYDIVAIGLCKAGLIYDENKGAFSSLAYKCMDNELRHHYKKLYNRSVIPANKTISYEALITNDGIDNDIRLIDCLVYGDSDSTYNIVANKMMLSAFDKKLTSLERKIVNLLSNGMSQSEIAAELNHSRQYINLRMKNIRRKLKLTKRQYDF